MPALASVMGLDGFYSLHLPRGLTSVTDASMIAAYDDKEGKEVQLQVSRVQDEDSDEPSRAGVLLATVQAASLV